MTKRKLLYLIDGSGYIFRAYYGIRALSSPSGEPTNAVYGFASMIQKVLDEEQPEYIAIMFDTARKSFRTELYEAYKANRPPPPEDLVPQFARIHEVTEAFKLPLYKKEGYEADDYIATWTRLALENDFDVKIITGDKDLMQLVNDRVELWEPMREKLYRAKEVEEKFGVPPEQIGDLLALMGDASDNIPGVRGVGQKTAAKLLKEHGTLEGVLEAAQEGRIKGKICQKIADAVDEARLSRKLVELEYNVQIDEPIESLKYSGPNVDEQVRLYGELGFRRLLARAESGSDKREEKTSSTAASKPKAAQTQTNYRLVRTKDELASLSAEITSSAHIALSMEYERSRMVDTRIFGFGLAWSPGEAVYIATGELTVLDILEFFRPYLEDSKIAKTFSSAKQWYALAELYKMTLAGEQLDTSIASYLIDAEDRYESSSAIVHGPDDGPHGVADVARKFLQTTSTSRSSIIGTGRDKKKVEDLAPEDLLQFVAQRADIALQVAPILNEELTKSDLLSVMNDIEMPLVRVLARLELYGVKVDVAFLKGLEDNFSSEIIRLEKHCHELAGREFKVNSPKQLREVLFEELGLKIIKRTKTGPSTDQSVLEELASMHPLPGTILDFRQITKLQSTYVQSLPKMVSKATNRVHTNLSQTVAATGRLSSSDPNLQNIPIRKALGRELRKAFVPEPDHKLISVDYSQIELRVLAHLCEDKILVEAFQNNADVHTRTASVLFEVPPEDVSFEQRSQAKAVNFGVLYGMGPVRLARELQIPRRVASQFVKDYFERQPGIRKFFDETLEHAKEKGFVTTIMGRRRWVREIESKNRGARAASERIAMNTPIQGSAADLIKLAMIRVSNRLEEDFPEAKVLLQVHDELLLEAPSSEAEAVAELVKVEMERAFPLNVPLLAVAHIGDNWDEAH
ncbi:MAG: DNA polymerase I [Myxococcota bacterium]|nr:DNA polymerase I [Myxococcota bacterium]